jgi:hypothetical protein
VLATSAGTPDSSTHQIYAPNASGEMLALELDDNAGVQGALLAAVQAYSAGQRHGVAMPPVAYQPKFTTMLLVGTRALRGAALALGSLQAEEFTTALWAGVLQTPTAPTLPEGMLGVPVVLGYAAPAQALRLVG